MQLARPTIDPRAADLRGGPAPAVALLTPPGRGALAVVGVVGAGAVPLVDRLFHTRSGRAVAERPDGGVCFGQWRSGGGSEPGEELVIVRRRADLLEVHCHGGLAASAAVIGSLVAGGAREVQWPEWLWLAGSDEIEVEARAALARAGGPRAARILTRQLAGALGDAFARLAALDAAGDHAAAAAVRARLRRAARVGLRLDRPWRVVLAGAVNAGKSSLMNALAGHGRSLVAAEAGTTRDVVEMRLVLGGWEVDLVDTAGLRNECDGEFDGAAGGVSLGAVEREGIARGRAARAGADLVLRVVAADAEPQAVTPPSGAELVVVTKCDLGDAAGVFPAAVRTSAVTGAGLDALVARIVAALVPEERDDPDLLAGAVPFMPRQVALLDAGTDP